MAIIKSAPCHGCADRQALCHMECPRYARYRQAHEATYNSIAISPSRFDHKRQPSVYMRAAKKVTWHDKDGDENGMGLDNRGIHHGRRVNSDAVSVGVSARIETDGCKRKEEKMTFIINVLPCNGGPEETTIEEMDDEDGRTTCGLLEEE